MNIQISMKNFAPKKVKQRYTKWRRQGKGADEMNSSSALNQPSTATMSVIAASHTVSSAASTAVAAT